MNEVLYEARDVPAMKVSRTSCMCVRVSVLSCHFLRTEVAGHFQVSLASLGSIGTLMRNSSHFFFFWQYDV